MNHMVTATFSSRVAAEDALRRLEAIGIAEDQLGMIVSDSTRGTTFTFEETTKADESAAAGATFGGVVGAVLAGVAGAGTLAIPGLNLVIWGPIVAGLAGLGAGAVTGGLIGMLVGAGIPEYEAKLYEESVKEGGILLVVRTKDKEQRKLVRDLLDEVEAHHERLPETITRSSASDRPTDHIQY